MRPTNREHSNQKAYPFKDSHTSCSGETDGKNSSEQHQEQHDLTPPQEVT
jgi:hypothetical protein